MTKMAACHPDKPAHAKGLCRACYAKDYRQSGPRADCHPGRQRYTQDGLCQPCYAKRHGERNPDWRERRRHAKRASGLKVKYGITPAEYDRLYKMQGGKCAICRGDQSDPRKKKLCVDHHHTTGIPRGLLCDRCNRAIGLLGDDPEILEMGAKYLRHWRIFTSGPNGETVGRGCGEAD